MATLKTQKERESSEERLAAEEQAFRRRRAQLLVYELPSPEVVR